ncbi:MULTISPECIES: hypothetical protein [Sphingomonas]|uniref:STAS/SEC14 domain-containing protein n=1 Tax=Sphingomonas leidyi TaxID=68569 RepID=A0A7X5ZVM0_9SPHN|nr:MULTISPECIES: hypothetical protein [Sphingomonas]MBN8810550.1 hypothetical protein [Sphingomonas sp.]NIJ65246.1 hypothetical protein [Sphingomonas leidyi]OJY51065.1 MAG: hypothetical protein BGP17_22135 [Sphingomonas sp. 67-41]
MPDSELHSLRVDRERKLIDLRLKAMLSPEDAAWIGEELRAAVRDFGPEVGQHVTLYDASSIPVVPQATAELIINTFNNEAVRPLWARKVAFVVVTALARLQVQRLREVRPDIGIFGDREEAIAWLLEE